MPVAPPSGVITILFSDIEGSTRRWERYPAAMQAALAVHDALIRRAIEAHDGYVVKTTGDGVHAVFADAARAVLACVDAQRLLQAHPWEVPDGLRVRMGLHTGPAEARDGDYYGPALNRAARLMSAGHGGQILLSQATQAGLPEPLPGGLTLRDLGERRLKDLIAPERIYQLVAPGLPAEFPPLNTLDSRPNNLPAQPTPLLGREREIARGLDYLRRADVRLLTLTGPGGAGKTRLALQFAAELVDEFAGGVSFVGLATIADPALVVSTVAQALGVRERGERPLLDALQARLRAQETLLLLDNFEQILAAAPLVADLLAAAPKLKVIVTSRAALHLRAEQEFPVPPLRLPADLKRLPPPEGLTDYPAIALFVQRAAAARPDFSLTAENAPAVAEICYRLDGLPLAIELAAARVKLLPPPALLGRLGSRLKLLTGGPRDLPARHQTLRRTIDWSHDLLDPAEQTLFRRLAVFSGGCTLEAAEAVCNPDSDLEIDLLDGLASLVDKSLIRQEELDGEPRFAMLETIREYGLERLLEWGEDSPLRQRHMAFYVGLAEEANRYFRTAAEGAWLKRLDAEIANLWQAIETSVGGSGRDNVEAGLRLGASLWRYWHKRPYIADGLRKLQAVLARADGAEPELHGRALHGAAALARLQGNLDLALPMQEQAVRLLKAAGNKHFLAGALNNLGVMLESQGRLALAAERYEEAGAIFGEVGNVSGRAMALDNIGNLLDLRGDYARAARHSEEALALHRSAGSPGGVAHTLMNLGETLQHLGEPARAAGLLEESLALARDLGNQRQIAYSLNALAGAVAQLGDLDRASALYEEAGLLCRDLEDAVGLATSSCGLAAVASARGESRPAERLYVESLTLFQRAGISWGVTGCLEGLAAIAWARGDVPHAARLLASAEAARSATEVVRPPNRQADFERLARDVRDRLGDTRFVELWGEGTALSPEDVIRDAAARRMSAVG